MTDHNDHSPDNPYLAGDGRDPFELACGRDPFELAGDGGDGSPDHSPDSSNDHTPGECPVSGDATGIDTAECAECGLLAENLHGSADDLEPVGSGRHRSVDGITCSKCGSSEFLVEFEDFAESSVKD